MCLHAATLVSADFTNEHPDGDHEGSCQTVGTIELAGYRQNILLGDGERFVEKEFRIQIFPQWNSTNFLKEIQSELEKIAVIFPIPGHAQIFNVEISFF